MATVTGLTAERMQEIIDATIVDADVINQHLILTKDDGSTIDAGNVGGVVKAAAFPVGATDGDLVVRTDLPGDPIFKLTDGVWEQQPRMGAVTPPAARLTISAASVSIPNNANTAVAFDVEDIDTDSMHDTAVNNTRIMIKTPGLYLIQGDFSFTATASGQRVINISVNGSLEAAENDGSPSVGAHSSLQTGIIKRLSVGDYIELVAFQNSGGSIASSGKPHLSATWLGGAGQTVDERGVPSVRVYTGAAQSIPTAAGTLISFNSERWDTEDLHSNTTNTSRITIKTPGLYLIQGRLDFASNSTGRRGIILLKNGTNAPGSEGADWRAMGGANVGDFGMTSVLQLVAGDYLEIQAFQDSGGALNVTAELSATLIGSGKTVTPFARVYKTNSTQSIPDLGVDTALSFDAEESDNDNIHDIVTNNSRLTCRTAGIYAIHANVSFASNTNGSRWLQIRKNGSTFIEQRIYPPTGDARDTAVEISCIAELAVGDYIEVVATLTGVGSSLTVTGGQNGRGSKFEMVKIGAPISPANGYNPVIPDQNALSLGANLTNIGSGYRKSAEGLVVFEGAVIATGAIAVGAVIATLPVGSRPSGQREFVLPIWNSVSASSGYRIFRVETDGTIFIPPGIGQTGLNTNDRIMLAGINFFAA